MAGQALRAVPAVRAQPCESMPILLKAYSRALIRGARPECDETETLAICAEAWPQSRLASLTVSPTG